jgi:hypothetical protein
VSGCTHSLSSAPQHKLAARLARVQPVEERRARAPHVQVARGRGRKAHLDLRGGGASMQPQQLHWRWQSTAIACQSLAHCHNSTPTHLAAACADHGWCCSWLSGHGCCDGHTPPLAAELQDATAARNWVWRGVSGAWSAELLMQSLDAGRSPGASSPWASSVRCPAACHGDGTRPSCCCCGLLLARRILLRWQ